MKKDLKEVKIGEEEEWYDDARKSRAGWCAADWGLKTSQRLRNRERQMESSSGGM